jgi:plasmid stabilization system protein ParE
LISLDEGEFKRHYEFLPYQYLQFLAAPSNSPLEDQMPRGDKTKYTDKQKRKAAHIAESYEEKGLPAKDAESRAWATVNKDDGGGKKSGAGRSVHAGLRSSAERSASAKKSAAARGKQNAGSGSSR